MTQSLIIVGSPRAAGVSARYAAQLESELEGRRTDSPFAPSAVVWRVSDHDVSGCIGCEVCRSRLTCAFDDDMAGLMGFLDACDEVHVVCPVYFAGPPAQFKCVLDRLQPYWERRCGPNAKGLQELAAAPLAAGRLEAQKRPVTLHIIGSGGDPHGFEPLVTIVRSAFGAAGFSLVEVRDRIGWGQGGMHV